VPALRFCSVDRSSLLSEALYPLRPVSREGFALPQAHGYTRERSGEHVARLCEASLVFFESGEPPRTLYLAVERRSPFGITRRRVYRTGSMDCHRSVEATGAPTHGANLRPLPVVVIQDSWYAEVFAAVVVGCIFRSYRSTSKYRFSVVQPATPYSANTIAELKPLPSRTCTGATPRSPGRVAISYDHGYDDQLESLKADCEIRTGPSRQLPARGP
jgi:hypothetical protein